MGKPLYRVTRDEAWLRGALAKAEHVLQKGAGGMIYCHTHNRDAKLCAEERQSELVLQNSLDEGKYVLTVIRVKPYWGRLTLTRGDSIVLEQDVGLAYDAPFGPDAEDVQGWYELAIEAADQDYLRRGETPPKS